MRILTLAIILLLIFSCAVSGQYYLRGEVKDEKGNLLPGVRIYLYSKGTIPFFTGDNGSFGIPSPMKVDTIKLCMEGFDTLRVPVNTQQFQSLKMKMLSAYAKQMKSRLASVTKNLSGQEEISFFSVFGESYSNLLENGFVNADKYPETGFALNIDRASYSNMRRFLNNGMNVPSDAVRIEEMLNYFSFRNLNTDKDAKQFTYNSQLTSCPWNKDNQLLFLNLNAPKLNLDKVPPTNLVFLIDISGSMDKPNRLPLLQSAFKLLTENLRALDTISIVTYGGGVAVALSPTCGKEKDKINRVIDSLVADGDTPGEGAIRLAYSVAKRAFIANGVNRVILATDGDFNVGQSSERQLEDMISFQRQSGIFLTCLGVGMGNYKDSKLETLAKKGNGNFAYLDNIAEAEKVMVTEFTKTVYNVAEDSYLTVNFNPATVGKYRLIGFDNKKDAIIDNSSELEGGEIGSGHSMMVIFEIEPPAATSIPTAGNTIGKIVLQYKSVPDGQTVKQNFEIPYVLKDFATVDDNYRFAASVAMFGCLLRQSKYTKNYTFSDVLQIALPAINPTNYSQQEFLTLVQKADKIYNPKKKRKDKDQ